MKEHGLYVKSCDGDFQLDKVNAYNTTTDQLIANPDTAKLILAQMREVIDLAQACGVRNLDYSFADEMMEVTKTMVLSRLWL